MSGIRIVIANSGSLASYPEGGGHWSCLLQYPCGLVALNHDVFWLEVLESTGNEALDQQRITTFFHRFDVYGLRNRCCVLLHEPGIAEPTFEHAQPHGRSKQALKETVGSADLVWNLACSLKEPLLSLFRRRVLVDLDPGHLQVSALTWDMGIQHHEVFLSVGRKLHDPDCRVPTLGEKWHQFSPFVHLPMWNIAPDPGKDAPFTSVTQWTWEQLSLDKKTLSVSKRDAYLKYIDLPWRTQRPFELAANIDESDATGDRALLLSHGWKLPHPHRVSGTVVAYQRYIKRSRAEFQCPKPIHIDLKTGWFSDRSASYLATGRPVLAEDTGFSEQLPTGRGLLCFSNVEQAVAGVAEIDANYAQHMRAARELAEEYLSSAKWLPVMLAACGY
jgi:hypothetical protein